MTEPELPFVTAGSLAPPSTGLGTVLLNCQKVMAEDDD